MTIGGTTEVAVSVEREVAVPRPREAAPTPSAPAPVPPGPDVPSGCRCGHPAAAHEHFRPGSDCGACGATGCARYRAVARRRGLIAALRRAVRRAR